MHTEREIQEFVWGYYETDIPEGSYKRVFIDSIVNLETAKGGSIDLTEARDVIVRKDNAIRKTIIEPVLEDREFQFECGNNIDKNSD